MVHWMSTKTSDQPYGSPRRLDPRRLVQQSSHTRHYCDFDMLTPPDQFSLGEWGKKGFLGAREVRADKERLAVGGGRRERR